MGLPLSLRLPTPSALVHLALQSSQPTLDAPSALLAFGNDSHRLHIALRNREHGAYVVPLPGALNARAQLPCPLSGPEEGKEGWLGNSREPEGKGERVCLPLSEWGIVLGMLTPLSSFPRAAPPPPRRLTASMEAAQGTGPRGQGSSLARTPLPTQDRAS